MQPLPSTIPDLEVSRQPFDILDDLFIKVRDAQFETMSHRQLIRIHEEFIGERGAHLHKLEASKLIRLRHELGEILPALQYSVTRMRANEPVLKELIDSISWQDR